MTKLQLLTISIGSPDYYIDSQITNHKISPREVTQLGTEHNWSAGIDSKWVHIT